MSTFSTDLFNRLHSQDVEVERLRHEAATELINQLKELIDNDLAIRDKAIANGEEVTKVTSVLVRVSTPLEQPTLVVYWVVQSGMLFKIGELPVGKVSQPYLAIEMEALGFKHSSTTSDEWRLSPQVGANMA